MNANRIFVSTVLTALAGISGPGISRAQVVPGPHIDVLAQQINGQLVTGAANFDTNTYSLGLRSWSRELPSNYQHDGPGYNAQGAGAPLLPAGSQALPPGATLSWDYWPMRINNVSSNLFYWNGKDSDGNASFKPNDVHFGPPPDSDYRFYFVNFDYFVDGTDAAKMGGDIGPTDPSDGSMHIHRFYFLDDGDGDSSTHPADGVYLFSMRLRMAGLKTSLPIYLAFGTDGLDPRALDLAAAPWVANHAGTLALLGDYNHNGDVDAADYTVWRNSLGQSGFALPADGDDSRAVDMADYLVWRDNYGKTSPIGGSGAAAIVAPEPASLLLATLALLLLPRRLHMRPPLEHPYFANP